MSTLEIKECAICGKLFQSLGTSICPPCSGEVDRDFLAVRDYIYNTQEGVNVNDILENTGVSEKIVLYLMKEGRLSQDDMKIEGYLKCAVCGAPISGGRLCSKCSAVWSSEKSRSQQKQDANTAKDAGRLETGSKMHTHRLKKPSL